MQFILILLVLIYIFFGLPIFFAIGLAIFTHSLIWGEITLTMIPQQVFYGVDKFIFVAIPLFMLFGEIMLQSGMAKIFVNFSNIFVGRLPGGLAQVNIVASMFFAGITGSAVSDTAAIGSILIPSMKEDGYEIGYSVAVTASSSVIGPIIPPSILMIVYASIQPVSTAALFAGGLFPGIAVGLGLMILAWYYAKKLHHHVSPHRYSFSQAVNIILKGLPVLLLPIIILGGILGGVFTPTEAAAIAVTYSIILGMFVYRTLKLKQIYNCIVKSMVLSGSVLILVAISDPLGWLVSLTGIPTAILNVLNAYGITPIMTTLLIFCFILILGSMLEVVVIVLIFAPILAPVAMNIGFHPVHFGVAFVVTTLIGLITPPFGMCLFVGSEIGQIPLNKTIKSIVPFLIVEIIIALMVFLIPEITLMFPRFLGLIR
jgi:tripartite ATP-independent transporter DctM subunit